MFHWGQTAEGAKIPSWHTMSPADLVPVTQHKEQHTLMAFAPHTRHEKVRLWSRYDASDAAGHVAMFTTQMASACTRTPS